MMKVLHGFKSGILSILAVFLMLGLVSCGGGVTGSGSGSTGSVALLLTDATTDEFSQVNITITRAELIADSLKVTILSTTKTVDLLSLSDETNLFALSSGVPSGWYEKIRLHVSDIELVRKDGTIIHPMISGNGKLDLNPREKFYVESGGTLLLQVDLDANKSIHIVNTGHGDKYNFRPVVFIDVLDGQTRGKLLRLYGQVRDINTDDQKFELCPKETLSRAAYTYGSGYVDAQNNVTECVAVYSSPATSFFDANGDPAAFADLADGDLVTAVGNVRIDTSSVHEHNMGLDAVVVEWGQFLRIEGIAKSLPDALTGRFDLEVFSGQGFPSGTVLTVELQDGARVYSATGEELTEADIEGGLKVKVDGVLFLSDTEPDILKASFAVVFKQPFLPLLELEGVVHNLNTAGRSFDLFDPLSSTARCVDVPLSARVFLITVVGSDYVSEEIALSELSENQSVQVYGNNGSTCFTAQTILAEPLL
ncbi:MAG: DUF4382 domain-containing protein [Deltaproteobacteria bacterium]|nr:DUF4382 domain-containing protein [Deltaproteobacteria bacterium]